MTDPAPLVVGQPGTVRFRPRRNGTAYDPASSGGAVTRLRLWAPGLTRDNPPTLDVGPATRPEAFAYDFAVPAPAVAGTWLDRVDWTASGTGPAVATDGTTDVGLFDGETGPGGTAPVWTPTPDDVADLIPQRLIGAGGRPSAVNFTDSSRPSTAQAQRMCDLTAREVARACGTVPAELADDARDCASIGAAARIVGQFFGQDGDYEDLWAQYLAARESLVASCIAVRDGESIPGDGAADLPPSPLGSFPPPMTSLLESW